MNTTTPTPTPRFTLYTGADIQEQMETRRCDLARRMRSGLVRWGHWRYIPDDDAGALAFDGYEIDLARCNSGATLLDWILQLEEKDWITAADLGDFIRAVADILPVRGWPHAPRKRQPVLEQVTALLGMVSA